MLPQKLGLDVVREKGTGRLVTLEINGINSGYSGLDRLGESPKERIFQNLGAALAGKKTLIHPSFPRFHEEDVKKLAAFFQAYRIQPVFSPFLTEPIAASDLEVLCGVSMGDVGAIVGMGDYLFDDGCSPRMINQPVLEQMAGDKALQYKLLREIPLLGFPTSRPFECALDQDLIRGFLQQYGKILYKTRHDARSEGVFVLTPENIDDFLGFIMEMSELKLDLLREHGYQGHFFEPKEARDCLRGMYQKNHDEGAKLIHRWDETDGILLFQRFVDTEPVADEASGNLHFAKARLLWFGEYVGGYWALSGHPADHPHDQAAVVCYSDSHRGKRFSDAEREEFAMYANAVVPAILEAAARQTCVSYSRLEQELARDVILGSS